MVDALDDPALDAVREVVLDGIRGLYEILQPEGWDPDDGVDESTFDYEAIARAALTGRSGTGSA
jgi:hypothetical protein